MFNTQSFEPYPLLHPIMLESGTEMGLRCKQKAWYSILTAFSTEHWGPAPPPGGGGGGGVGCARGGWVAGSARAPGGGGSSLVILKPDVYHIL